MYCWQLHFIWHLEPKRPYNINYADLFVIHFFSDSVNVTASINWGLKFSITSRRAYWSIVSDVTELPAGSAQSAIFIRYSGLEEGSNNSSKALVTTNRNGVISHDLNYITSCILWDSTGVPFYRLIISSKANGEGFWDCPKNLTYAVHVISWQTLGLHAIWEIWIVYNSLPWWLTQKSSTLNGEINYNLLLVINLNIS